MPTREVVDASRPATTWPEHDDLLGVELDGGDGERLVRIGDRDVRLGRLVAGVGVAPEPCRVRTSSTGYERRSRRTREPATSCVSGGKK